jgi:hypothetical protein
MATRGWNDVTMKDITARELKQALTKPRSKYGAESVVVDGEKFDSKKEANRYRELCVLQRVGDIRDLKRQQPFVVTVNGVEICRYFADFTYEADSETGGPAGAVWRFTVEDVKSAATRKKESYRLKKKLVEAQFGFVIRET